MLAPFILATVFFVIAGVLTYFAVKQVFKVISTVLTIIALACAIVLFGITYDTQNFQEQLAMSVKLFVYEHDGFMAAFVHQNKPAPLLLADVSAEKSAFEAQNWKDLKGDRALVFVLRREAFVEMTDVKINGNTFQSETILDLLEMGNPRDGYIAEVRRITNIPPGQEVKMDAIGTNELKGILLAALVNEYLHSQSLVRGVHDSNVDVYPSSITTWVMENVPYFLLKYILRIENA